MTRFGIRKTYTTTSSVSRTEVIHFVTKWGLEVDGNSGQSQLVN